MEVILMERIEKLGQMGDIVSVKPGYARNYLLPQKKAVSLTEENKAYFETQRAQLEAANLERKTEAEAVAAKLDGLYVVMIRQAGETGHLYGSVKSRDISDRITETGFTVSRQQVSLEVPIKSLGLHNVQVALHPEVSVPITVNVARSDEEAEIQRQTGKAVITTEEEEQNGEGAPPESADAASAPEDGEPAADQAADADAEPAETETEADAPAGGDPAAEEGEKDEQADADQEE
jgi:large subunit ribosomal protein L9